jgi:GNAT superfamily N-acetyltransferase
MEHARAATSEDVDDILRLSLALREELEPMRGGRLWRDREAPPEPSRDRYAALIHADAASLVVGTIDGSVVGFGLVELEELRSGAMLGVMTELFVEDGARSVGVGEAIANHLVAYCDERDCVGVDALALPGHRATKNFFEESGFTARALTMHRPHQDPQTNTRSIDG